MLAALAPIAGSTPISTPTKANHSSWKGRDRISQITLAWDTVSLAPRSSEPASCAKAHTPTSTARKSMPIGVFAFAQIMGEIERSGDKAQLAHDLRKGEHADQHRKEVDAAFYEV